MSDSVVITGHCGGIGAALTRTLTDRGFSVIGIDRQRSSDAGIREIEFDLAELADSGQEQHLADCLERELGNSELKGLINNAAVQLLGPVATTQAPS